MKKLYPLLSVLLFLSIGFSQQEYNSNDLVEMDNGLWTEKFSDEPISGKVYGYFGEVQPLKKVYVGNLLNGKKDGLYTWWYDNGQKLGEGLYKDGKPDGLQTQWNRNGQKVQEWNYKDGKEDGLRTEWNDNGQKIEEVTYKNDKRNGLWTEWNDNG